jgi:hypothetical protein
MQLIMNDFDVDKTLPLVIAIKSYLYIYRIGFS